MKTLACPGGEAQIFVGAFFFAVASSFFVPFASRTYLMFSSVPAWLHELFPSGAPIVGEELRMGAEAPPIHPEESAQVADAVVKRRVEFAAGRACARRALTQLGIDSFVLKNGPDRAPRWPSGVVGSISHAGGVPGGFCGVVVGRSSELLALGLDIEVAGAVAQELWPRVATPRELAWLERRAPSERRTLATVLFSAKECFYKARFPLCGEFLEFGEVEVALDPAGSTFEAGLTAARAGVAALPRCKGRYVGVDGFVITGIAVSPGDEIRSASAVVQTARRADPGANFDREN